MSNITIIEFHGDWSAVLSLDRAAPKNDARGAVECADEGIARAEREILERDDAPTRQRLLTAYAEARRHLNAARETLAP